MHNTKLRELIETRRDKRGRYNTRGMSKDIVAGLNNLHPNLPPIQQIYLLINNISVRPLCRVCNACPPGFRGLNQGGYSLHCSPKCRQNDPETRKKIEQTCIERYGSKTNLGTAENLVKYRQTCMERYGVDNPNKTVSTRQKIKDTCMERFSVGSPAENTIIHQKMMETCQERYGVDKPLQNKAIHNKAKATTLKNYGVEYPNQNAKIMEKVIKSSFSRKDYTFPSGKTVQVQGYEPQALDKLLAEGTIEDDIITSVKEVPEIRYEYDGKTSRYYPDIYVPSRNLLIEVKSEYTITLEPHKIEAKKQAVIDNGYDYQLWIMDR